MGEVSSSCEHHWTPLTLSTKTSHPDASTNMLIGNGGGVDLTWYTTELFYYTTEEASIPACMVSGGLGHLA